VAEFHSRFQDDIGEAVCVFQRARKVMPFQQVGIRARFNFRFASQQRQDTLDSRQIPAIGSFGEEINQSLNGCTGTSTFVGLDDGQHLSFSFRKRQRVAAQQRAFGDLNIAVNILFLIRTVIEHAQVWIYLSDQQFKPLDDTGFRLMATNGGFLPRDNNLGALDHFLRLDLQLSKAVIPLDGLFADDHARGFI